MSGSVCPERITNMYVFEEKSIPQVANSFGLPQSRVRKILLSEGVALRSRAEGIRLRTDVLGQHIKGKKRTFTQEWCSNISKGKKKHGDKHAKGTSVKQSGYVEYTRGPHKGRSVHVVRMEQRLGRPLAEDECVHHIDGDRANNSINNLALVTRSAHSRLHARERKLMKGN